MNEVKLQRKRALCCAQGRHEKHRAKVIGATSSEGFLVLEYLTASDLFAGLYNCEAVKHMRISESGRNKNL